MRVYYFTAEQFALSNIINERIKISLWDDLNDPFELSGIDLSDKDFRSAFNAGRKTQREFSGVICFSRGWNYPMLWGHYGDKHKGICLGFDIEDKHIEKIHYSTEKLKPEIDMNKKNGGLTIEIVKKLLCWKYKGWEYEDEVRIIVQLKERDSSGFYFTDFKGNMELKEIILGHRSNLKLEQVAKYLCSYKTEVSVFKSRIAFKKYEVVRDESINEYIHRA